MAPLGTPPIPVKRQASEPEKPGLKAASGAAARSPSGRGGSRWSLGRGSGVASISTSREPCFPLCVDAPCGGRLPDFSPGRVFLVAKEISSTPSLFGPQGALERSRSLVSAFTFQVCCCLSSPSLFRPHL